MHFSRTEIAAWGVAVLAIILMGVIALHGHFHLVKQTAAEQSSYRPQTVQIVTFPPTIGRYTPPAITLHVGQTAIFKNISNAAHTVTDREDRFNSGEIDPGQYWKYAPVKPGAYPYYCIYHPGMVGIINVLPASSQG